MPSPLSPTSLSPTPLTSIPSDPISLTPNPLSGGFISAASDSVKTWVVVSPGYFIVGLFL
jgi:hypothetical protein